MLREHYASVLPFRLLEIGRQVVLDQWEEVGREDRRGSKDDGPDNDKPISQTGEPRRVKLPWGRRGFAQ